MIGGKYRIEAMIGRGGMSVVYGAVHQVTGRRFAIKLLLPEISSNPDSAKRFVRESQVSGRVQHPNVVEIFDIGEDNGAHYMVMEWLDGESLAERIEGTGPLSLNEMSALLLPCMRGVAAAHAAGIIHRDLKPANIFICKASRERPTRAKVLDFGISKLSVNPEVSMAVTHTGMVMGTPHYMSPEQMQGQPVDARTDVYAFGVILYQVFSARLPFPARTYGELVMQIATGKPEPLEQLVPWLPPALARVISRAMAREPAERFQNMDELIAAVEQACGPNANGYDRDTRPSIDPHMLAAGASTPWAATREGPLPVYAEAISRARYRRFAMYGGAAAAVLLATWLVLWMVRDASAPPAPPPALAAQPTTTTVVQSMQGVAPSAPAVEADVPPPALTPRSAEPTTSSAEPASKLRVEGNRARGRARQNVEQAEEGQASSRAVRKPPATSKRDRHRTAPVRQFDSDMDLDAPSRTRPAKSRTRAPTRASEPEDTARDRNPLEMQIQ
jgi:serine/threonine-protein kinase